MIKPYTAVGLIPSVRGIRKRRDIKINLEHLKHLAKAACWLSALDLPVRLIAVPEGALQAFNDEVLDLDHVKFARECAIDIPGEETEELGKLAREYDAFIIAQAKAHHPDWRDRVRVDLCLRRDRYRSSSRSQGAGEVGQLDEGFADGALPDSLRETNLPQKPISEARANEARRVPEENH
jgi:hypothetical protein